MKLNKKLMAVNLLASLLMTEAAMARLGGIRTSPEASDTTSGGSTPSGKPSDVIISQGTQEDFNRVVAVNVANCKTDPDVEKYFPLEFFSDIVRDAGAKLDIQVRPNNKIAVKIPPVINVCGSFVPELRQNKDSKNVTVMMKLIGTKKVKSETGEVVETPNTLLTYKEFIECMNEQKFMVDQPGKKEKAIDFSKVEPKEYSESVYTMDYLFDKKKDIKNTVTVTYGSPKSYFHAGPTGFKALYGEEKGSVPGESCMSVEKVGPKTVYVNKGQDVLIEEINAICRNGDAQEIAEARRSLGNAEALKDIADKIKADMDTGYLNAVKKDQLRISKAMEAIEDKIKADPEMDAAKAKKLVGEYSDLASELNTKFLDPAIIRLSSLLKKREGLDDDSAEAKELDEEIRKLNVSIREFSKRPAGQLNNIYRQIEKHALTESGRNIEDILLKSAAYGRVYIGKNDPDEVTGRGAKLTLEGAQKFQTQGMQKFEKVLVDWTDRHLVSQGNTFPLQKTQREINQVAQQMDKRWADYEKKENQDFYNYCGAGMLGQQKNPVKCAEFKKGFERRRNTALAKRKKDLEFIKGKNEKLGKMNQAYGAYERDRERKLASEDASEINRYESASSISGYEDSFADRFPGYYGNGGNSSYDPSLFFMQQQQMGMPQMQQQQMGGWPSIR